MKFLTTLAIAATALAQVEELPTDEVWIGEVTYGGSGCPQNTVSTNFNLDRTAVTLIFDEYIASRGPGIPFTESRKNCGLSIQLNIPQGWQYSIATVDYRGFFELDAGVSGHQQARYNFQGERKTASKRTPFFGPQIGDYNIRDEFGFSTLVWSPCGAQRNLSINSSVRVESNDPEARGLITTDSIDGAVVQKYGLQWSAMSNMVSVAEILKKEKLAVEKKLTTSIDTLSDQGRPRPVRKPKMEIVLVKSDTFDEIMAVEKAAADKAAAEEAAKEAAEKKAAGADGAAKAEG